MVAMLQILVAIVIASPLEHVKVSQDQKNFYSIWGPRIRGTFRGILGDYIGLSVYYLSGGVLKLGVPFLGVAKVRVLDICWTIIVLCWPGRTLHPRYL